MSLSALPSVDESLTYSSTLLFENVLHVGEKILLKLLPDHVFYVEMVIY
jgi:hypothetical protein